MNEWEIIKWKKNMRDLNNILLFELNGNDLLKWNRGSVTKTNPFKNSIFFLA